MTMKKLTDRRGENLEFETVIDEKHISVDFTGSSFYATEFTDVQFNGCDFTRVNLTVASFKGCSFYGCTFHSAVFTNTTFFDSAFGGCTYDGARIGRITMLNTDWDGALLQLPSSPRIVIVPTTTGLTVDTGYGGGPGPVDDRVQSLKRSADHLRRNPDPAQRIAADKLETTARLIGTTADYLDTERAAAPGRLYKQD